MLLSDLKKFTVDGNPEIKDFHIVLATTIVKGKPMDEGVQIRDIGKIDQSGDELQFYPSAFVEGNEKLKFSDILSFEPSGGGDLELIAIDRMKILPDNSTATLNKPVIGTLWYEEDNELWLLQDPKEQWPDEWFE